MGEHGPGLSSPGRSCCRDQVTLAEAYGYAAKYPACARLATLSTEALRAARGTGRRKIRAGKVYGCSPFVADGPTANSAQESAMAGALEGWFASAERQPLACTNEETLLIRQGLGDFVLYQRDYPVAPGWSPHRAKQGRWTTTPPRRKQW